MKCTKCRDTGEVYTAGQVTVECECVESLLVLVRPTGIAYVDKSREKAGDYVRVAFLPFSSLVLAWEKGQRRYVSPAMQREIERDAGKLAARRGQEYQVSTSGQTVILGGK